MGEGLILFAGPSLAGSSWVEDPRFTVSPPCKQGDVFLACQTSPSAIGIVDGFFEGFPSVWHKEILWALSQGVHVLGASSMGALRAAELAPFGMVGVGKIFEGYFSGHIEDDDEVALLHAPREAGHLPLTVPMVNVRATLEASLARSLITQRDHDIIVSAAKALPYKVRTWDAVWQAADAAGLPNDHADMLAVWVADNQVDQKRLDAQLLCEALISLEDVVPFVPGFDFEVTEFWWRATEAWERSAVVKEREDRSAGGYTLFGG